MSMSVAPINGSRVDIAVASRNVLSDYFGISCASCRLDISGDTVEARDISYGVYSVSALGQPLTFAAGDAGELCEIWRLA